MDETAIYSCSNSNFLTIADVHSGSHVCTLKSCKSSKNGIATFISTNKNIPSLILSSQSDRATINVYTVSRETMINKISVPEKLNCLAFSNSGVYLAAGSVTGKLYIWDINTRILLFVKNRAHLQSINNLVFNSDDTCIITGSNDGQVHIWSLVDCVSCNFSDNSYRKINMNNNNNNNNKKDGNIDNEFMNNNLDNVSPLFSLIGNGGEILKIVTSNIGNIFSSKIYTASSDDNIRIWDSINGKIILTFSITSDKTETLSNSNSLVQTMAIDSLERSIYVGLSTGEILQCNLYDSSTNKLRSVISDASSNLISISLDALKALESQPEIFSNGNNKLFKIPENNTTTTNNNISSITALEVSFDGTLLISGDSNGKVSVWDIASRQVVRSLRAHTTGPITSLCLMINYKKQFQQAKDSLLSNSKQDVILQLDRSTDPEINLSNIGLWKKIDSSESSKRIDIHAELERIENDYNSLNNSNSEAGLEVAVADLTTDIKKIYEEFNKLKKTNQALWSLVSSEK